MKFDYTELKKMIKESRFKNQTNLAKELCFTLNGLNFKLNGRREMTAVDIFAISRALDIPASCIGKIFFTPIAETSEKRAAA